MKIRKSYKFFHSFAMDLFLTTTEKKIEFMTNCLCTKNWVYPAKVVIQFLNSINFQFIHQHFNSFRISGPTVKVRKDKLSIFIFTHLCFPNLFKNVKILKKLKLIKIPNLFFDVFIFIWIFKSPTLTITNWSSLVLLIPKLLGSKKNPL